jgi:hypothetical protein
VIGISLPEFPQFQCTPAGVGLCKPSVATSFHEIFSGTEATVQPDGSFCYTDGGGLEVPENAFARFSLRMDCGPGTVPPPQPGQPPPPTEHRIHVRLANVDDDAYVWAGSVAHVTPIDTANADCSTNLQSGGEIVCDLTDRLRDFGQATELIFKIGNSGGFNSHGDMYVEIDGNVAWEGHEYDAGWKHTGWTYRGYVEVDRINGTAKELEVDSCYNVLDCVD